MTVFVNRMPGESAVSGAGATGAASAVDAAGSPERSTMYDGPEMWPNDATFVMSLITLSVIELHPSITRTSFNAPMDSGRTATATLVVNGQEWTVSIERSEQEAN